MRAVARFLLVALATTLALAVVPAAHASLSDNLDNPYLTFMTAGDDGVAWVEVNGLGRTGGDADCVRSGHFPDLDQFLPYYFKVTSISTQVTGPGELSFWWKISSAPTHTLDVCLGGDRFPTWITQSGEQDWVRFSGDVPAGTWLITWVYTKDNLFAGAVGDAAWIDDVQYLPDDRPTGTMTVNDGAEFTLDTNVTVHGDVSGATEVRVAATTGSPPQAGDWSSWSAYADSRGVTLPYGDGSRTVYAQYRNAYGAVLELQDDIVLDLTAPQITSLTSPTHPFPDEPVADDDPRFEWSASDASGITGFSCVLDTSSASAPDDELDGTGSSFSYTDVQTGELYFHLRVRDRAGRWSEVSTRRIHVAPTGAPSIAWTASSTHPDQDAWWPIADVSLSWQSTSPATTDGYSWVFDESASTTPDTAPDTTDTLLSLPGQADGQHYFHVRARGLGGIWGAAAHRRVRIDTMAPAIRELTSSSHPDPDIWYGASSATFTWQADAGPSGVGYSWSVDGSAGGTPDEIVDGSAPTATLGLADGEWYFHVMARSGAGVWSAVATRRVRVDAEGPSISGLTCSPHVSESAWYAAASATFTWSAEGGGSGVAGYSWSLDHSGATVPDTTVDGTSPAKSYGGLADGVWYFHVRAVDGAGLWSSASHRRIQIDSEAPAMTSLTSTSHPDETDWCRGSEVRLSWAGSDGGSGVAGYSWSLDNAAATVPDQIDEGPATAVTVPDVADGDWWAHVRCRDAAGTWSGVLHRRLRVDGAGPVITGMASASHPDPSRWYALREASISWSASDTAGVAGYLCAVDQSATTVPVGDIAAEPSVLVPNLADGVWYLHVRGRDVLGQEGATTHRAVRIDTRGPATFALANAAVRKGGVARLRFKVTDPAPNGGSARVRIEIRSRRGRLVKAATLAGAKPLATALSWKVRCPWTRGVYTFKVLGWDAAGNRQLKAGSARLTVK
jgi:hypothetical protein